eukprot:8010096-Pyramimonas_sp.AAC.1
MGVAQSRPRVYMVGSTNWKRKFTWPSKVPIKWTAKNIIKRKDTDNAKRLPPASAPRARRLVSQAYRKMLEKKIDPRNVTSF